MSDRQGPYQDVAGYSCRLGHNMFLCMAHLTTLLVASQTLSDFRQAPSVCLLLRGSMGRNALAMSCYQEPASMVTRRLLFVCEVAWLPCCPTSVLFVARSSVASTK